MEISVSTAPAKSGVSSIVRTSLWRAEQAGAAMLDNDNRCSRSVKLFLCGDVMTGRGIDQILP